MQGWRWAEFGEKVIVYAVHEEMLRPGTDLLPYLGDWRGGGQKGIWAKKRSKFSFTEARARV